MNEDRTSYSYDEFSESEHFLPEVDYAKIIEMSGSDFLWEILEPLSLMVESHEFEAERVKRLSPEQKALYFFWYLDSEVTNGGFIQFFWNGYDKYLNPILKGLERVEYKEVLELVREAEVEYQNHKGDFERCRRKDDMGWLYEHLKRLSELDDLYDSGHLEKHYFFFENFVKDNIGRFIQMI